MDERLAINKQLPYRGKPMLEPVQAIGNQLTDPRPVGKAPMPRMQLPYNLPGNREVVQ